MAAAQLLNAMAHALSNITGERDCSFLTLARVRFTKDADRHQMRAEHRAFVSFFEMSQGLVRPQTHGQVPQPRPELAEEVAG